MRGLHLGLVLLAADTLTSCATTRQTSDISASHSGAIIPAARVSKSLSPHEGPPSEPQTGNAIEVGVTRASGTSSQSLGPGSQPILFGDQTFSAPQQLDHKFDFNYVDLAYRYRLFFGAGNFGIEALLGLGYGDLGLRVSSSSKQASEHISSAGLVGGLGALWRFRPGTSLQSRYTLFASGNDNHLSNAARFDLYLAQAVGRNFALRAGFTTWTIESKRESATDSAGVPSGAALSPVHVKISGPALGLDAMF
jgi:hypothetical protein